MVCNFYLMLKYCNQTSLPHKAQTKGVGAEAGAEIGGEAGAEEEEEEGEEGRLRETFL